MTPIWREAVKHWWADADAKKRLETLLRSHVFDMRECFSQALAVVEEIHYPLHEQMYSMLKKQDRFYYGTIDIGQRAIFPCDNFWFEFDQYALWGYPTKSVEKGVGVALFKQKNRKTIWQRIGLACHKDGGEFWFSSDEKYIKELSGENLKTEQDIYTCSGSAAMLFACIAITSSSVASGESVAPHQGLKRTIRTRFPNSETKTTKITLGRRVASPNSNGISHEANPKAYHFCRAHTRLKRGKVERVRAHWRGDPAFGVRIASYRVLDSIGDQAQ